MKKPVRVAITGAAGSIGYALVFRAAAGEMLGADQPVILQLVELPRAVGALEGVAMELEDCAFPTLAGVEIADNPDAGFKDADVVMLIGGKPRQAGMDRADLIRDNGPIFVSQGKAINDHAAEGVRVITVANPCNTNCLIALHNAPRVKRGHFTAMTRLDQNRAYGQIARKLGGAVSDIRDLVVWGNHSSTMFPNFEAATYQGEPLTDLIERDWLEGAFMKTVTTRGGAIIKARGASSAASAANAALEHIRDWFNPPEGAQLSMAIPSDGSYGVPEGLVFSFPCEIVDGQPEIIQGVALSDYAKSKIEATTRELEGERDVVKDLLS